MSLRFSIADSAAWTGCLVINQRWVVGRGLETPDVSKEEDENLHVWDSPQACKDEALSRQDANGRSTTALF